ncbi:MAG TPA: hypothetical protein PKZ12_06670 [Smithellaceae bacterium]|nr:hypothetical protein [Smithellaceae bacterium]
MKKSCLILLALGLFAVFSMPCFAADIKISGSYYAGGIYLNKTTLKQDTATDGPATAFYYQRLRVRTDYIVSPGLSVIMRFDALERAWGVTRSTPGTTLATDSAGTIAENENIAIDWAYIDYKSPIGIFAFGFMNYGSTGTIFGNNTTSQGRIKYSYTIGPATINAALSKVKDRSLTTVTPSTSADSDNDVYHLEGVYNWKAGRAGLNINYYRSAENRPALAYKSTYYLFTPYAIAKIGPVALQAELNYATGKFQEYDSNSGSSDVKLENITGWIDATAAFGPVYVGGTFAYVSGDDPNTTDKKEGGTLTGGRDWSPTLIIYNEDRSKWVGAITGNGTSSFGTAMENGFLYQLRVGVKPNSKLDIMTSITYANADKKPAGYLYDKYGYELDLTANYKITNNLSYMIGGGYLWTGDYFKATSDANKVSNNYLVVNKLILTF